MALTPADLEAIARIVDARVKPLEQRQSKFSGEYRQVAPDVKTLRDSQHDIEEKQASFETVTTNSLIALRSEMAEVKASIPPAATAAAGAERAAHRVEGKTEEVKDAIESAKIAAKWKANQTLIAIVIATILQGLYQAWQHIAAAAHP